MKYQIEVIVRNCDEMEAIHECFRCARHQCVHDLAGHLAVDGALVWPGNDEAAAKMDLMNQAERLVFPTGFVFNEEDSRSLGNPGEPIYFSPEAISCLSTYDSSIYEHDELFEELDLFEKVVSTLEEVCPPGVTVRRFD